MANNKRFIAKNGLQAESTRYVSPDGLQAITVSMLNTGKLSIDGTLEGASVENVDAVTLDGLDSLQFLRSDVSDVLGGSQYDFTGTTRWQVSATDPASQRVDSRDDATNFARAHWYGQSDAGATSNFRHAWYDGSSYVNVTAQSGGIVFGGTLTATSFIGKATDSDKLDNLNSTQFLRSDINDTTTGDLTIQKANAWLTLDSPGSGTTGVDQGAGISVGENGYKGGASLHLTYTGDGYGHIGMGSVSATTGIPANRAMQFYYQNNNVTFDGAISAGNITTTGYLRGPSTFTIDPASFGDNTGTVVIAGNFQVDGTTTTINSTTLAVDDKNIELAKGSTNATAANGAGIDVDLGTNGIANMRYNSTTDRWTFNKNLQSNTFIGALSGNANTATAWQTSRTIQLTGAVTGTVSGVDGTGNVSISTTATSDPTLTLNGDATGSATFTNLGNATLTVAINNDSHTHQFSNLTNKTSGTGNYSTTGSLEAGRGGGGVALTINDSQGNANVTFNHANGIAEQAGNVGRIEVNTDATTASYMGFHVANNASAGAISPAEIFRVTPAGVEVTSGIYTGNGSGLTTLNASNISSGTIADARLPANISSNISGTAANADLLDNLNSTSFLRSDANNASVRIGNQITLSESADRADLLEISSSTASWAGLQIRNTSNEGRWSFMTDGNVAGIYDDENNDWHIYMTENAGVSLRYNSLERLSTTAAGVSITGTLTGNGSGLTSLDASNISSGTINDARLPASISSNITGTAANASLLDNINSTSFLRSDANDTASGWYTFTNSNGLETKYGIQGGYGDSNSSGSDWGANIWAMGNAYMGTGTAGTFVPGGYQLAWIRAASSGYRANVGEGVYVFSQNSFRGGIGTAGLDIVGDINFSGTISGNGSGLTTLNASNISSGTISDARLPASISSNITGTAANASLLDNINSTSFLRSDATDSASGRIDFTSIPQPGGIADTSGNLGSIEISGDGTRAAMMSFHRAGSYASYFGLDTDNKWKVGGWSAGANAYEIFHQGNSDSFSATGTYAGLRAQSTTKADVGLSGIPNINGSTVNFLRGDGNWITPPDTNTTYSAGTGITLSGTTFSLTGDSFNSSGTYAGLRAQSTTASDVGLGNVTNVASSTASTANTNAQRNSSGDINARLFRSEYDTTNSNIGYIMTQVDTVSNNYIRPSTPTQVNNALGIGSNAKRDLTISTAEPTGGVDGDIWYQYE